MQLTLYLVSPNVVLYILLQIIFRIRISYIKVKNCDNYLFVCIAKRILAAKF